jgi:uncharacterized protein
MYNGRKTPIAKNLGRQSDAAEIATDPVGFVRGEARRHFEDARGSHAWDHTERVLRLCERIGPVEGADMPVLQMAALLHDIGRAHQDRSGGGICHARRGAAMARPIVARLALDRARRDNLIHCIAAHRFRTGPAPESIEARVLFDADKLDAIGAVGVARAYLFAGEVGARLHSPEVDVNATLPYTADDTGYREYRLKLRRIKDRMVTAEGKRLAERRHRFMEMFFQRFLNEYEGKE